jgi:FkbM family methyltransferase
MTALPRFPKRGAFGRWRRALRRRLLEPIVLGNRSLRETVLNALAARGHLVYCALPEGHFFVDPSDRVVASWMMWHGGWQRAEIAQATDILARAGRLPPDAVFVDAGANIGTHTVYALRNHFFARAIACEPEPKNARLLEMNIAANDLSPRTTVVRKALGAMEGSAVLHLHPRNKGAHAVGTAPSRDGTDQVEVPMARLDDILRENHVSPAQIGVIWIDVEGSEPNVVRGLGEFLGAVPLAIEYAPDRYADADGAAFRQLLQQHYTALHRLGPHPGAREPISALAGLDSITDILVY